MQLPHLKVRTLMLAIAVLALLISGAQLASTSYDYFGRARHADGLADRWREAASGKRDGKPWGPEAWSWRKSTDDRVRGLLDLRLGDCVEADVPNAVEYDSLHANLLDQMSGLPPVTAMVAPAM